MSLDHPNNQGRTDEEFNAVLLEYFKYDVFRCKLFGSKRGAPFSVGFEPNATLCFFILNFALIY